MEKLYQIIKLAPNLDKLLKLINSLEISKNNKSKTELLQKYSFLLLLKHKTHCY